MTVALILLVLFLLFTGGIFLAFLLPRRSAGPFIPSPQKVLREALALSELKPGERFYDLGAGTGKALILAEKEFGASPIGFEIAPFAYLLARMNMLVRRSGATMRFESLWNADLRDADVVFCFLAERVMPKVEKKLREEMRPGARVVCFTFGLPGKDPDKIVPVHGPWQLLLYRF